MRFSSTVCWLALLFASNIVLAAPEFPKLSGRVVDEAGMINANTEARIAQLSAAHEEATGNQVVVVTVPDLQGYAIEEYGYQLGRHWGIGQAKENNGVLLIASKAERKIRIEVGYGLEGQLTDAVASNIINAVITPAFKRAQFDKGFLVGSTSIIEALGGEYKMRERKKRNKSAPMGWFPMMFLVLFFVLPNLFGRRSFLAWLGLSLLTNNGGRRRNHSGGYGGGGFGGGGGFSGGGGGFGGGGASGGW